MDDEQNLRNYHLKSNLGINNEQTIDTKNNQNDLLYHFGV